jgi:selenocysteine lyase/cysteine desulfurase
MIERDPRSSVQGVSDRRGFLRRLAQGSIGLALAPVVVREARGESAILDPAPLPFRPAPLPDEAYWTQVRAAFPLRDGIAPMNAANLCPAPRVVNDAVEQAMRDVEGDVSSQNRSKYGDLLDDLRVRLGAYLGADPAEVAVVRNTTEANNVIVGGIPLGAGDEVVIWDQNHQTNNVAWEVRAQRYGFTVKRVTVPAAPSGPDEILAAFESALTPATRVLSFSDVSNMSGIRPPTAALCRLGRERGIHVHVDGAQSFGLFDLDLHALGCDSYSSSAHKWFMGPKEGGILYVRAERVPDIWPGIVGVGWGSGGTPPDGAEKYQTLGQRNDATIAGMSAALDFHLMIGKPQIQARVFELAARLKDRIAQIPGAQAVTPRDPEVSGGVVIFRFDGVSNGALNTALYNEHRVAGASTGGMRLCPHVYNTFEDVDRAAAGLAELVPRLRA